MRQAALGTLQVRIITANEDDSKSTPSASVLSKYQFLSIDISLAQRGSEFRH